MSMRLSLITICYNSERTLVRTVESVLKQRRLPEEYLFVDGGSTDGTLGLLSALCERLAARGVSARVLSQVRHAGEAGIPSAWNQGLAVAEGDVIGLLNSDDWYEPDALERVMGCFAEDASAGAVAGATRFVGADGREVKVFRPGSLGALGWKMPVPHPGLFVRRSTYDRIGLYDVRYRISADYDFVWRCHGGGISFHRCMAVVTNMELGGLANSSRSLARRETREIASRHGSVVVAWGAWLLRAVTGR